MQYLLDEILKLPQHQNTVMFKYGICDFIYVHQVIISLASLSDLSSLTKSLSSVTKISNCVETDASAQSPF